MIYKKLLQRFKGKHFNSDVNITWISTNHKLTNWISLLQISIDR